MESGLLWRVFTFKIARLVDQSHFALNGIKSFLDDLAFAYGFLLLRLAIVVQEYILLQLISHQFMVYTLVVYTFYALHFFVNIVFITDDTRIRSVLFDEHGFLLFGFRSPFTLFLRIDRILELMRIEYFNLTSLYLPIPVKLEIVWRFGYRTDDRWGGLGLHCKWIGLYDFMLCGRDGWLDTQIEKQRPLPKFDGIAVHFDGNLLIIIPILKNVNSMGFELLQQSISLVGFGQL